MRILDLMRCIKFATITAEGKIRKNNSEPFFVGAKTMITAEINKWLINTSQENLKLFLTETTFGVTFKRLQSKVIDRNINGINNFKEV